MKQEYAKDEVTANTTTCDRCDWMGEMDVEIVWLKNGDKVCRGKKACKERVDLWHKNVRAETVARAIATGTESNFSAYIEFGGSI